MLIAALTRTIGSVFKGYFIRMLLLSLAATAVGYVIFFYGITTLLSETAFVTIGWLDWVLDWVAGIGIGILAWFLFPAILPLIAYIFLEQIAGRIEKHEYGIAKPPTLPFFEGVWQGLSFAALSIFINLILLPFYLFPLLFPILYYPVNAYLLGREIFETCAARHVGRREAKALRQEIRTSAMLAGGLIVIITNTPLANLFAPFLGVAIMVHLYQRHKPTSVDTATLLPPEAP